MKLLQPAACLVTFLVLSASAMSQKADSTTLHQRASLDSLVAHMYDPVLAGSQLHKSRTGKFIGYAMLTGGMLAVLSDLNNTEGNGALFSIGCLTMALSNPVLTQSARAKGRAEMLMMDPEKYATPEQKALLVKQYRNTAGACMIGGWVLFLGGLVAFSDGLVSEEGPWLVIGATSMFSSLPVWMVSSKNKGRISIITGKYAQNHNLSIMRGQRSIGIALAF